MRWAHVAWLRHLVQRAVAGAGIRQASLVVWGREVRMRGGRVEGFAAALRGVSRQPKFQAAVAEAWEALRADDTGWRIDESLASPTHNVLDVVALAVQACFWRAGRHKDVTASWRDLAAGLERALAPWLASNVDTYVNDIHARHHDTSAAAPSARLRGGADAGRCA